MSALLKKYAVLGLILIGFAVRVYGANDVSVSPDERNVINKFLGTTFWELLNIVTLHGFPEHTFANILIWSANKLGETVFILRWPAICFGVLTLALIYKVTRAMVGRPYALAVTFLLTFSSYHVLFSHRIRGYSEMIFLALASFYFLWRGMGGPTWQASPLSRWRDWVWFALVSGLGIYNHFYASTLLATQGIIVAIWLAGRAWRSRLRWIDFLRQQLLPPLLGGVGGLFVAILLFTPLLPQFFRNFVADDSHFPVSTASFLSMFTPYLELFNEYSGAVSIWSPLLFLILILAGIVHLWRTKPAVGGMLSGWLLVPLLMVIIGQIYINWFYVRERYLVYMVPAYMMLAGAGWVGLLNLGRRLRPTLTSGFLAISLVILLALSAISWTNYVAGATFGNWQAVSNFLAQNAQPTDLIMCEPYIHGWKEVDLPSTDGCTRNLTHRLGQQMEFIYPIYNLYTVATYRAFAENPILLERNSRVWVVLWNLPEGLDEQGVTPAASFHGSGHTLVLGPLEAENSIAAVAQALEQVSRLAADPPTRFALLTRLADLQAALGQPAAAAETLAQVKTILPADERAEAQVARVEQRLQQPPLIVTPAHPLSIKLGEQILFRGYSLTPESPVSGQPLQLTLFWESLAPVAVDYSTFLHLRNEANQTIAQLDVSSGRPTSSWWAGDTVYDTYELMLPADLPAGDYRLLAGLYNLQTLERLPVSNDHSGENAIELTRIEIKN